MIRHSRALAHPIYAPRRFLLAALLVLGGACVAPTETTGSWTVTVEKSGRITLGEEFYSEPELIIEADRFRLEGRVLTPYVCDGVSVAVAAFAGSVEIRIAGTRHSDGCVMAVGEHHYVIEGRLRPGTYDLTVAYKPYSTFPPAATLLDTRIVIE